MFVERGAPCCEFLDARFGGGDDGMGGVVVFLESEALSADGLVDLRELLLCGVDLVLVMVWVP